MNKYLMLSAAVLLAGSASAQAANQTRHSRSFTFGTANGGSYCDGGTGYWSGFAYTWRHTNADCAGTVYQGNPGIEGNTPGIGRNVNMTDAGFFANNYGSSFVCSIDFPAKFKIGGTWALWCELSGTTAFDANQGVLLAPNPNRPHGNGKSLISLVRALTAEHRAKRAGQPSQ